MEPAATDLELGAEWEDACLEALGIDEGSVELDHLAAALLRISERHQGTPQRSGRILDTQSDDPATLLVRLLIFARRSFMVGRHLSSTLPELRQENGYSLTERGAGFGPSLLALGRPGDRVNAEELFDEYSPVRTRLLRRVGLVEAATPSHAGPHERLLIYGYSFGEITGNDTRAGKSLVERDLESFDALLLIEPGDRIHAQHLIDVRDALAQGGPRPVAPCPNHLACPMGAGTKDWCHFTIPMRPGPLAQRIAAKAGRDIERAHFSFLLYLRESDRTQSARLINTFAEAKTKARGLVCGEDGLVRLTALRRHRAAFEHLRSLPPAAPVRVSDGCTRKGDGVRVERPEDIQNLS